MDPTNRRITDVESLYESLRGALWLHSDLGTRLREAREEPVTVFKVTVFPHPYLVIARPVRFDVRMPLSYPGAPPVIRCETPDVLQPDRLTRELPPVRTPRDRRSSSVGRNRPSSAQSGPRSARSNSGGNSSDRVRPRMLLDSENRPTLSMLRTDAGFYGWTRAYSLPDAIFSLGLALLVPNQPRPQWLRPKEKTLPLQDSAPFRCLAGTEERQGARPTMEDRSASFPDFPASLSDILAGYHRASSQSRDRPSSRRRRSSAAGPTGTSARWLGKTASLFVVFDGHGGPGASEYSADWLPRFLAARLRDSGDPLVALWRAFQDTDAHFLATTEKRQPPASPVLWLPASRSSSTESPAKTSSGSGAQDRSSGAGGKFFGHNEASSEEGRRVVGEEEDDDDDEDAFVIPGVGSRTTGRDVSGRNVRRWYASQLQQQNSSGRTGKRGVEAMEDDDDNDDDDDEDAEGEAEESPISLSRRRGTRRNLFVQTTDLPDKSGCTAVAALIVDASAEALYCKAAPLVAHPDGKPDSPPTDSETTPAYDSEHQSGFLLLIGNVGDSRAVMSRAGVATVLTNDQKASRPDERARVVSSGGLIIQNRVMGRLAITRAIGDRELKEGHEGMHIITAEPELTATWLAEGDEFLLLACDGLFDVVSSEDAIALARYHLSRGVGPREVAGILADCALERGSNDNVTVQVVLLGNGVPRGCVSEEPKLSSPPQGKRGGRSSSRILLDALRGGSNEEGRSDAEDAEGEEAEGIGQLPRPKGISKTMPTPLPSTRASAKKSMWGGFGDDDDDDDNGDGDEKAGVPGGSDGKKRSPPLTQQANSSASPPGRPTLRDMQKRKGDNPFSRSSRRKFRPPAAEKSPGDDSSPTVSESHMAKSPDAPTVTSSGPASSSDALDTALHSIPTSDRRRPSPGHSPPTGDNAGHGNEEGNAPGRPRKPSNHSGSHGLAALGSLAVSEWSSRPSGPVAQSRRRRSSGHQLTGVDWSAQGSGAAGRGAPAADQAGRRHRRSSIGSPVRMAGRQASGGNESGGMDGLLSDLLQRTGDALEQSPHPRERAAGPPPQRRDGPNLPRRGIAAEHPAEAPQEVQEEDLMNFLMDPRNFDG